MKTEDFNFSLPNTLIAQHPATERTASRMLFLNGVDGSLADKVFLDLPSTLQANDLLIFNDTRVIKARLFGTKHTGGHIEVLVERIISQNTAYAHVRASRSPKIGTRLTLSQAFDVEVIARHGDLFELKFLSTQSVLDLLSEHGALPLPAYITHTATNEDEERYQTVFGKNLGAVAAPTAGLHFNEAMLATLKEKGIKIAYITLHVGAGTFQPVRVDHIHDHKMHSEFYNISQTTINMINEAKKSGSKVTAIGTTTLRALESAARVTELNPHGQLQEGGGETDIFITPGYQFKVVDRLFTNFHLPKSTLLMLVSAFAGVSNIKNAYAHAIFNQYRFFSYGDAMLIEKSNA